MKKDIPTLRDKLVMLVLVFLVVAGISYLCQTLMVKKGANDLYQNFLLASSLLLIYFVPFVLIIRKIVQKVQLSKKEVILSALTGTFISTYLGILGNMQLSKLLIEMKLSKDFLSAWGAALTAPFTEELSKGFAVLLVVLLCRRLNLKQGLTIGIIVGVGFEIVEDVIYVFQSVFQFHESGFATAIDRVASATVSHWLFASLFALGLVSLLGRCKAVSKAQAIFWLVFPVFLHFVLNSPFEDVPNSSAILATVGYALFYHAIIKISNIPDEKQELVI